MIILYSWTEPKLRNISILKNSSKNAALPSRTSKKSFAFFRGLLLFPLLPLSLGKKGEQQRCWQQLVPEEARWRLEGLMGTSEYLRGEKYVLRNRRITSSLKIFLAWTSLTRRCRGECRALIPCFLNLMGLGDRGQWREYFVEFIEFFTL